jgi:hypothetical protein
MMTGSGAMPADQSPLPCNFRINAINTMKRAIFNGHFGNIQWVELLLFCSGSYC